MFGDFLRKSNNIKIYFALPVSVFQFFAVAMADQKTTTSPNDLASRLIQHTKSFLEEVEDLVYFLPNWISHRSDTLESLGSPRRSTGPLSCFTPAACSIGPALVNKLAQVDHRVAAAASTIGNAMSFGFTCGVNKGKQEFNNRRLNVMASRLQEDLSNTTDLEGIIARVKSNLGALLKDFQACWNLPADQRDSNQMLRGAGSILKSSSTVSETVQYQSLIGWADQVMKLLDQFLAILGRSRAPNGQVRELLRRNSTPEVVVGLSELNRWVEDLKQGYDAIKNARNAARQNVRVADNFLSRMLTSSSSEAVAAAPEASNSSGNANRFPNNQGGGGDFGDHDIVDESTNEIDRWFEEVRRLIINSIEVAEEVSRLFSDDFIPLR